MRRRSLYIIGILLFCFFIGACDKKGNTITEDNDLNIANEKIAEANDENSGQKLITETNDMNIDEVETPREDVDTSMYVEEDNANVEQISTSYPAGTVIDVSDYDKDLIDSMFVSQELNKEIIERIAGKSYKEDADIPHKDLRYIKVLHMGFDGKTHIGEMIVNKAIVSDVVDIFKELYAILYHIEKMILIDDYDADDIKSMEDNNTSSFNFRYIEGTSKRSVHGDGLAIDINPLYNPYVRTRDGKTEVLPESALEYSDRDNENEYYIRKDDPCYKAFTSRSFTWGGEWKNSKDYQHFEKKLPQ